MNGTMKRALSLLMLLAMMVSLVACGGGGDTSEAAGTYNLTKMDANGVTVDIKELSGQSGVEVKISLILEEGGNFTLDMGALSGEEAISGTWEAKGSDLKLTSEGDEVTATLDGTTVTMEEDGQVLVFEKE